MPQQSINENEDGTHLDLDAAAPAGAFDNEQTERAWDKCRREKHPLAAWDRYMNARNHEQNSTKPDK
ncbi:hypothetical protein JKG47_00900 [Acidithiobacillus sp. MC6.1]|nr:hypothetical protein [Acidithiobacillus sp. MC6.1]